MEQFEGILDIIFQNSKQMSMHDVRETWEIIVHSKVSG